MLGALIPVISNFMVEPYVSSILGMSIQPIRDENLYLSTIIVLFMVVMMFGVLRKNTKAKKASVYLSGVSVENESRVYLNALSKPQEATARNWYMEDWFGEAKLTPVGTIICYILILVAFIWAIIATIGFTALF